MTPEQATELRKPFPPEMIGKLPRAASKQAAEANVRGTCDVCGKYHVLPAIHLDYVGHAAVTDRLLSVDPEWSWRPMGIGPNGEPLVTNGGLWIELTVCGVTRPGFGDQTNSSGVKEMIGDAIRNAAMRFGVALDLWAKEDLHTSSNGSGGAGGGRAAAPPDNPAAKAQAAYEAAGQTAPFSEARPDMTPVEYLALAKTAGEAGALPSIQVVHFGKNKGALLGELSKAQLKWYATEWKVQDDPQPYDHRLKQAAIALHAGHDSPDFDIPFS